MQQKRLWDRSPISKKNLLIISTLLILNLSGCSLIKRLGIEAWCYDRHGNSPTYKSCVEWEMNHPDSISVECKRIKKIEEASGICNQLIN